MAVAATVWGASAVTNVQLPNPGYATFGTGAALVTLPGTDPHLTADIAAIQAGWGPADLIENQDIATGTTQPVQLRAENPRGHYNAPLLGLVSGTYPAGPGQVPHPGQVRLRAGAAAGRGARGRRGEPAVVGIRARGRARIATSVLASRRPAKTMARVPVVAALSGRPAPPKAVRRSAVPGVIVFAAGVACLAFT